MASHLKQWLRNHQRIATFHQSLAGGLNSTMSLSTGQGYLCFLDFHKLQNWLEWHTGISTLILFFNASQKALTVFNRLIISMRMKSVVFIYQKEICATIEVNDYSCRCATCEQCTLLYLKKKLFFVENGFRVKFNSVNVRKSIYYFTLITRKINFCDR